MALKDFYFTLMCDSEFAEVGQVIGAVGRHLKKHFISANYGSGVGEIAIGIVISELGHLGSRRKKPKFIGGQRKSLLGRNLKDTLEFYLYPSVDSVRYADSVRDLVETLMIALGSEVIAVRALKISDFDTQKFLEDLDAQLRTIGESPSLWPDLERRQFAMAAKATAKARTDRPALANVATLSDLHINEFPSAVLAFVERELPLVRQAMEHKDETSLGPLLERVNTFFGQWENVTTAEGDIFDAFEDCGHLLADLGREIAIECDRTLSDSERKHLHFEFQKRLEACRASADRVERLGRKPN